MKIFTLKNPCPEAVSGLSIKKFNNPVCDIQEKRAY